MRAVADLVGGMERQIGTSHIAKVQLGRTYSEGSLLETIGIAWVETASGLMVPAKSMRQPGAADAIAPYLTDEEVFGRRVGDRDTVVSWLALHDRAAILRWCAKLLNERQRIGGLHRDVDLAIAATFTDERTKERATNLIKGGAALAVPQALLLMAKLAILHGRAEGGIETPEIFEAMILVLQGTMGTGDRADEDNALAREVVASQSFASGMDEGTLVASFRLRWHELPAAMTSHPQHVDLASAFERATGVPLDDPRIAAFALYAAAQAEPHMQFAQEGLAARIGWPLDRLRSAIELYTATPERLREEIAADPYASSTWSFDALRRFPVVETAPGVLLVLSMGLLLDRAYGWPALFDVVESDLPNDERKDARDFFPHVCEREMHECLRQWVPEVAGRRFYDGEAIMAAFRGVQTADSALDYGHSWIVAEISAHRLARGATFGVVDLESDLRMALDKKLRQIDSTIRRLMADEKRLTGSPALERRRYLPLLILTEGFPVNPVTWQLIAARAAALGLLHDARVGPLRIIDREEAYMLEGLVERGFSALDLLVEHSTSSMYDMPLNHFLAMVKGLDLARPERLGAAISAGFEPLKSAVEAVERAETAGRAVEGT